MGKPYFSKLKTVIHEPISVIFLSINHKSDNGAVATRKHFVRHKTNQQLHQLKKNDMGNRILAEILPIFLFFYFDEIEGLSRYTKRDP